jgi:hypothetical protein
METERLAPDTQGCLAELSPGVDETTDSAVSLPEGAFREDEPSLWGDEYSDEMFSLLEGNARRRRLLVQLQHHLQKRG